MLSFMRADSSFAPVQAAGRTIRREIPITPVRYRAFENLSEADKVEVRKRTAPSEDPTLFAYSVWPQGSLNDARFRTPAYDSQGLPTPGVFW